MKNIERLRKAKTDDDYFIILFEFMTEILNDKDVEIAKWLDQDSCPLETIDKALKVLKR